MYTNDHLLGMFALGMAYMDNKGEEIDLLLSRLMATSEELSQKISDALANSGNNMKEDTVFHKMLTARKLQRMLNELQAATP